MVKKARKKNKKTPACPSLEEMLHDLEHLEFPNDDEASTTTPFSTSISLSTLLRLGFDPENYSNRYNNPFWHKFMQNLKDLERLKTIEKEISNISNKLVLEKQKTESQTENLRRDIEKQKALLAKIKSNQKED